MKHNQLSDLSNQDEQFFPERSGVNEDFFSFPDQVGHQVIFRDNILHVRQGSEEKSNTWRLSKQSEQVKLEWVADTAAQQLQMAEVLAVIEAAFTRHPHNTSLRLTAPIEPFAGELLESGILVKTAPDHIMVHADLFWQQARLWLSSVLEQSFPLKYVFSQDKRHPLRPPKPNGIVYKRYIPWLSAALTFRTVDIDVDLEHFNRWMNEPAVVKFWQEAGDLHKHRKYLEAIDSDAHVVNLVACLDDQPFGYFEIYWAKEDRIAPYYDVADYDRGWHVLIGEPHMRGKRFVTAWLPSISHYLFLDDHRTQRLVIEPRADNEKMIRNLGRCGYANLKEFDFPHKRAVLSTLSRERFFSEQLWAPRDPLMPYFAS